MGDLLQIIRNVADIVPNFEFLFKAISWIIGCLLVIIAVKGMAKRSERGPQAGEWSQHVLIFFIGIAFVALPNLMTSLSITVFGSPENTNPSSIFSYAPITIGVMQDGSAAQEVIEAIVVIVRFVGLIAVMRGLYLLQQSTKGQGQQTFGPGMTFVIAGTIAFNFQAFVGVMESLILGG